MDQQEITRDDFTASFVVLVPFYNAEKTLGRVVESLASQTNDDWHALFLDDGSKDNSEAALLEAVEKYNIGLGKITYVKNHTNIGIMRNVIKGVNMLPDDKICGICDGDDFLYPHTIDRLLYYYREYDIDFAWTNFTYYPSLTSGFSSEISPDINPRLLFPFWHMSHMRTWKAGLFKQIPERKFMNPNGEFYDYANDLAIMFSLWEETDLYMHIPEELYYHDISESDNTTRTGEKRKDQLVEEFQIRCQVEDYDDMLLGNHFLRHAITLREAVLEAALGDPEFHVLMQNKGIL